MDAVSISNPVPRPPLPVSLSSLLLPLEDHVLAPAIPHSRISIIQTGCIRETLIDRSLPMRTFVFLSPPFDSYVCPLLSSLRGGLRGRAN